jgi:hypothetical protein
MLKSWPPGVGWGQKRGNCFYIFYIENIFQKSSEEELLRQKN